MGLMGMVRESEHIVYLLGTEAVCPECKGMMKDNGFSFHCNDCSRVFIISEDMGFDRKVKVKELKTPT